MLQSSPVLLSGAVPEKSKHWKTRTRVCYKVDAAAISTQCPHLELRKLCFCLACLLFWLTLQWSVTKRERKLHKSLIEHNTVELTLSTTFLWQWIKSHLSQELASSLYLNCCHCNSRVNTWQDSWSVFESPWLFSQNQLRKVFLLELQSFSMFSYLSAIFSNTGVPNCTIYGLICFFSIYPLCIVLMQRVITQEFWS